MDDYTPTLEDLANAIGDWAYREGHPDTQNRPELLVDDGETMLARFLAARDREVAERAWDECAVFHGADNPDPYNPYRLAPSSPVGEESD